MITGTVDNNEARITLLVRGTQDLASEVQTVIDTGYTASLSLPPAQISALDLRWQGTGRGTLADGSECLFDVFEAEVIWDGQVRRLLIDEADTDPLVGMELLSGYELRIEVCDHGMVEINSLPA